MSNEETTVVETPKSRAVLVKEWRCYKPTGAGKGAASKIQAVNRNGKLMVFLVISPQTGIDENDNASFAWSNENDTSSVTVKLGETDIGEILAVLDGLKLMAGNKEKGMFHKNEKGSTTITFEQGEYNGEINYRLRASKKADGAAQAIAHQHYISAGESRILKQVLEKIINTMY